MVCGVRLLTQSGYHAWFCLPGPCQSSACPPAQQVPVGSLTLLAKPGAPVVCRAVLLSRLARSFLPLSVPFSHAEVKGVWAARCSLGTKTCERKGEE